MGSGNHTNKKHCSLRLYYIIDKHLLKKHVHIHVRICQSFSETQDHSLVGMFSNTRSIPLMSVSVTVTSVTLSLGREKVIGLKFETKPLTRSYSSMLVLT